MNVNPYSSPSEQNEPPQRPTLTGWAMAADTLKLFIIGAVASIVGVPILFAITTCVYIAMKVVGVPIP